MTHTIKGCGSLCALEVFVVNTIEADYDDFGDKYDQDPDSAEDYGCGDMYFDPKGPTPEVLAKYGIDELEYWTITNRLQDVLSFGSCGWCV